MSVGTLVQTELRALAEAQLALHLHPGYYDVRIPMGPRQPVITISGLGDTRAHRYQPAAVSMLQLHSWLWRTGRMPIPQPVGWQMGCPNIAFKEIFELIRKVYEKYGRPALIMHSYGGIPGGTMRVLHPEMVGPGVAFGSPFQLHGRRLLVRPLVRRAHDRMGAIGKRIGVGRSHLDCMKFDCSCEVMQALNSDVPEGAPFYSVRARGRGDRIVHHRASKRIGFIDVEIPGSHVALPSRPEAYDLIDQALRPFENTVTVPQWCRTTIEDLGRSGLEWATQQLQLGFAM